MASVRIGVGRNRGRGYYNLMPFDSYVHALASKGITAYPQIREPLISRPAKLGDKSKQPLGISGGEAYVLFTRENRLYIRRIPADKLRVGEKGKLVVLNAKSSANALANVKVLSKTEFDKRFKDRYGPWEQGYANTLIDGKGKVEITIRDSGDPEQNALLLAHELHEYAIWKKLQREGIDPYTSETLAHNLNPVKVPGVDAAYHDYRAPPGQAS